MSSESAILQHILLGLSQGACRLFRNNVGQARFRDEHGRVHRVVYGLGTGSSDLIGWKTIEITPKDVGRRVAVFLAIEVKTESNRATRSQRTFIAAVRKAGGLAGVARSPEEALEVATWKV